MNGVGWPRCLAHSHPIPPKAPVTGPSAAGSWPVFLSQEHLPLLPLPCPRARLSSEPDSLAAGWAEVGLPPPPLAPTRPHPEQNQRPLGCLCLRVGSWGGAEEQEGGSLKQEKHCSHPLQSGKKQTRGKEGTHPIITGSEQRTVAPTQFLLSGPCPRGPYSMPVLDQHFVPASPSPERHHGPFHGGPRAPCWPR